MHLILVCAVVLCLAAVTQAKLNPETLTISGISAGAAMTVQFEYAYSSLVRAAGVIAGLPYQCSQGQLATGLMCMEAPSTINAGNLETDAKLAADFDYIDPIINLQNHTVYLFSGIFDTLVSPGAMLVVQQMYKDFGVTKLTSYFNYTAEHAWITNYAGNTCSYLGSPYINNCDLDFAGVFLAASFEGMSLPWNKTRGIMNPSSLITFDQTAYGANVLFNSMDTIGYLYIPQACLNTTTRCHLHVNFHGCTQDRQSLGNEYVTYTGLNEWAESNNIVILYPQAAPNSLFENPNACFDWWGYASKNYAYKGGGQMGIVRAMILGIGGF